jgi:hypothetical protein
MKNKILSIISFIMAIVCVFAMIGCAPESGKTVDLLDRYVKAQENFFVKHINSRNLDNFEATTLVYQKTQETLHRETFRIPTGDDAETVDEIDVVVNENINTLSYVVAFECKDGVIKLNSLAKNEIKTVERSLGENNEIVENVETSVVDLFHTVVYENNEIRVYSFDNVNPENNSYTVLSSNREVYNVMYYEIFQMIEDEFYRQNNSYAHNTFSKEGDYVCVQVEDYYGVEANVDRLYIDSARFGFDNKGNVKMETYNIDETKESTEKINIIGSISYGAKFIDRDTTGIEER